MAGRVVAVGREPGGWVGLGRSAGPGGGGCKHDAGRASLAGGGRAGSGRAERAGAVRRHGALGASERDTQMEPGSGGVLWPPDVEGANRAGAGW